MKNIVLNETPVRTSKNYGINNIEIKDFEEPVIKEFKNIKIIDNENCVLNHKEEVKLKFGLGEYFLNQSNEQSNVDLKIDIDDSFKVLDSQEKEIIKARYYDDLTQSEVAKKLNMTQVMVSRYEKKSLEKMKMALM